MKRPLTAIVAAGLIGTTGCVSVFGPSSASTPAYGLKPATAVAGTSAATTLKITPFTAVSHGSRSMIYADAEGRIHPLATAGQWKDTPEQMLTEAIYLGLARSNGFQAVVLETSPLSTDLTLSAEVREFGVHAKDGHGEATLELGVTITDAKRKLWKSLTLRASRPLANLKKDEMPAEFVVKAMNQNLEEITASLARALAEPPTPPPTAAKP